MRTLFLKQEHRDLAREAVRKSLVLLKNGKNANDPLLPLPKKTSKILVAGTHADNLGYQCGGWTINWQGFNGNNYTSGMFLFFSFFVFLFVIIMLRLISFKILYYPHSWLFKIPKFSFFFSFKGHLYVVLYHILFCMKNTLLFSS